MQTKYLFLSPAKPSNPLRKLMAITVTAAVLGLVLMFSVVLLVVAAIVGSLGWAYLWWKTREVRKQMREFATREMVREKQADGVGVFEGEVIRVVDTQKER
jgi:hypothetical protein